MLPVDSQSAGMEAKLAAQGRLQEGLQLPEAPLHYALADFIGSITSQTPVACTFEEGAKATTIGILAEQAVRTGTTVEVPEME